MLITFSGLDGAGKSTLIERLRTVLAADGHRVTVLTMYDDIGVYAFIRRVRDTVTGRPGWLTRPGATAPRASSDPDRLGIPPARHGSLMSVLFRIVRSKRTKRVVYCVDLLLFRLRLAVARAGPRVLVTDRYFYDSLADVADGRRWSYIHWFLSLLPAPDVPVFVDVPPEAAFRRKAEYSVRYLARRREVYRHIFSRVERCLVLKNDDLELAFRELEGAVIQGMLAR